MNVRRQISPTLLGFLLVLAVIEGLARSEFFVCLPVPSFLSVMHRKAAWLKSQPPHDLLIEGDSTAHHGIDARLLGDEAGMSALNAAFNTGSAIVMRAMTAQLAWHPKVVVFGLVLPMLTDDWPTVPHETDVATLRESMALWSRLPSLVGQAWVTYRRRAVFHQLITSWFQPDMALPIPPDDAYGDSIVDRAPEVTRKGANDLWQRVQPRSRPRLGIRYAALREMARKWQQQGTTVIYVCSPLSSPMRHVMAQHAEVDRQLMSALRDVTQTFGGTIVDFRDAVLDDEAFYDVDHLRAGPGRDGYSLRLGAAVKRILAPQARR